MTLVRDAALCRMSTKLFQKFGAVMMDSFGHLIKHKTKIFLQPQTNFNYVNATTSNQ